MSLLKVSRISVLEENNLILKNISFSQKALQKIAISGETGSGKSTLLQLIAGLVQPESGEVLFRGKRVSGPAETLVPGHSDIAYLSQQFELPPFLRVEQVLNYANTWSGSEAETLFRLCRIEHLLARRTNQLSGGERQRIALAKLLLGAPQLLLLDEPFSNLDMAHKTILKTVIRDIGEKLAISLILISHDPQDTLSWADQVLVMKEGQLLQQGTPEQIYRQPVNTYVAALFGNYNLMPASQGAAFESLGGIKSAKEFLLIRPERFKITATDNGGLPGQVRKVIFFGSYYELQVQLVDINITVQTGMNQFSPGDWVYLSVQPDDVWYL